MAGLLLPGAPALVLLGAAVVFTGGGFAALSRAATALMCVKGFMKVRAHVSARTIGINIRGLTVGSSAALFHLILRALVLLLSASRGRNRGKGPRPLRAPETGCL